MSEEVNLMTPVTEMRETDTPAAPTDRGPVSIRIEGMTCASCVGRVEKANRAVPGVASASVNLATERAEVAFSAKSDPLGVVRAIRDAGYDTAMESVELAIDGMTCASCVNRIEAALQAVSGVAEATVNLATEKASVRVVSGAVQTSDLLAAVSKTGYTARRIGAGDSTDHEAQAREREMRSLTRSVALAGILTLPVFVLEMGSHLIPAFHHFVMANIGMQQSWYLQFVLTTLVLFGPGLRFFQKGVPALLRRAPDMNSLVALGTFQRIVFLELDGPRSRVIRVSSW